VARLGAIIGHAAGFEPDPDGDGAALAATVEAALEMAAVRPAELATVVRAAPPALAALEERVLTRSLGVACPPWLTPKDDGGETFGAAGPLGVLAALAAARPRAVALVLDVCASGHVAAMVVRAPEAG
jgi:3-oxoacyl-[acyl-carrier-protein] synthase II